MYITLTKAGMIKQIKVGFSWTTFFFGFFVPLFRGDLKWAAIFFVSAVSLSVFTAGIGGFVLSIVFAFIYNKLYIRDMLSAGWVASNEESTNTLKSEGILA